MELDPWRGGRFIATLRSDLGLECDVVSRVLDQTPSIRVGTKYILAEMGSLLFGSQIDRAHCT